jgi:hypothetical protein
VVKINARNAFILGVHTAADERLSAQADKSMTGITGRTRLERTRHRAVPYRSYTGRSLKLQGLRTEHAQKLN